MDGFLLVNKPTGWTSHDVVFKLKKKLQVNKIGHTGTLDPFASGLLILCLGKATKLAYLFSDLDKDYEGTMVFGKHYDTYDTTGKILDEKSFDANSDRLKQEIHQMIGDYHQVPPMYSALKVNGQKLYDLARKGIEIERATRLVSVYDFQMKSPLKHHQFDFFVSVSKGTYIRSLAVDLGEKLDTYAALSQLKRIRVGRYHLNQAKSIEDIEKSDILELEDYFKDYPSIILNDYMIRLVRNGVYLDERQTTMTTPFVVKDQKNRLVAYYEVVANHMYKPVVLFEEHL